jgi:hypothetical protein
LAIARDEKKYRTYILMSFVGPTIGRWAASDRPAGVNPPPRLAAGIALVLPRMVDQITTAARHVPHHLRGDYVRLVADALTGRDFGDGDVHRAIVRASREFSTHR